MYLHPQIQISNAFPGSLVAHQENVQKANFLIDSDILGLGETCLKSEETVYFDGFQGFFANFGKGRGVAGFACSARNLEFRFSLGNFVQDNLLQHHIFVSQ